MPCSEQHAQRFCCAILKRHTVVSIMPNAFRRFVSAPPQQLQAETKGKECFNLFVLAMSSLIYRLYIQKVTTKQD